MLFNTVAVYPNRKLSAHYLINTGRRRIDDRERVGPGTGMIILE